MQNIYSTKRDKPGRKPKRQVNAGVKNLVGKQKEIIKDKEEEVMQKTMKIEGMMCAHCEAAVKKSLEEIPGVETAQVSHEAGTAIVSLTEAISDDVLRKAVEDKDYKVVSVE